MAGVVPNCGEEQLLQLALGKDAQEDTTLKLFTNDISPSEASVVGDFTEAAGGGYAAKTLAKATWTVAVVAGVATGTYAKQTWTFTGALNGSATIYGYFIIGATSGVLIAAERAATVDQFAPADADDTYSVTPVLKFK